MMTLIDETDSPTDPLPKRSMEAGALLNYEDERPAHAAAMLDKLNQLRKNKQFCDVILQVGSHQETHEIYAHKAVLAAASPYLLEMFTEDGPKNLTNGSSNGANGSSAPDENGNDQTPTTPSHYVHEYPIQYKLLNGVTCVEAFEALIEFAYTGRLSVHRDHLKEIYATATLLKIQTVSEKCAEFLVTSLTPDNCLRIRSIPGVMTDVFLLSAVDAYIRAHIMDILVSHGIELLPKMQIECLMNTSEERQATNEKHLYNMILEWIRENTSGELNETQMQEKIHMLYLNKDKTLHDCNDIEAGDSKDSDLVQDYKRLSRRYSGRLDNQLKNGSLQVDTHAERESSNGPPEKSSNGYHGSRLASNGSLGNTPTQQPSKPRQFLFTRSDSEESLNSLVEDEENDWKVLATTSSLDRNHSYVGLLVISARLWLVSVKLRINNPLQPPPLRHSQSHSGSMSSSSGHLSTGGHDNGTREGSPEILPVSDYVTLAPMVSPRCGIGAVNLEGKLLVCGGYDRGECLKSVELFDLNFNRWSTLKPMKSPRGRFDIASIGSKVYAIGGCDGNRELSSAEEYDSEKGDWNLIPNCPIACSNAGVCSLDGKVYLVGGWNGTRGLTKCFSFDPTTNEWTSIASLNSGRYQAGLAVLKGEIYAIGGCDAWTCLNTVEKYSPATDTWTKLGPLNTARRGCGAAVFNGKVYAVGGHDGMQSLCTVEVYDAEEDHWLPGPSLTACRANVGVCVVGTRLWAVGGFTGKTFLSTLEFLDADETEWSSFISRDQLLGLSAVSMQAESNGGGGSHESSVSRSSSVSSMKAKKSFDTGPIGISTIDEVEGESGPRKE